MDHADHIVDFGGSGPPMLLVHGLGASHVSWLSVGPLFCERVHALAVDLIGHGLTPRGNRSSSIWANRDLLHRIIQGRIGSAVVLVGNSLGGLISIMEAAEHPEAVAGMILVDPGLPLGPGVSLDPVVEALFTAYATPGMGEEFIRSYRQSLGPEGAVQQTLALCCVDPSRVAPDLVERSVDMARRLFSQPEAEVSFLEVTRTAWSFVRDDAEAVYDLIARVAAPTLLIQGAGDRIVPLGSAQEVARRRPDWTFVVLEGVGHIPMMEAPARFVEVVHGWLDETGLAPAPDATVPHRAP